MIEALARNWWAIALRGSLAIMFGLTALLLPRIALLVLVILFGAFALVDGIFAMSAAIQAAREGNVWASLLLEGAVGIAIGVVAFLDPGITALALLYLIAIWAVLTGVFKIVAAVALRREMAGEWLLITSGALSLMFGLLLAFFPGVGELAVVWLIGLFALALGVLLVGLAWRLYRWHQFHVGRPIPI